MKALKLGEALVKESLITREQLKLALERQVIFGGRLGTNIVELGVLTEKDLLSFLSRYFNVPPVDTSKLSSVDDETIACVSSAIAEKYKVVPFRKERNRLYVAMMDPRSMTHVDELRFITGFDIIPHAITELRLLYALEKYYGAERDLRYISIFGKEEEKEPTKDETKEQLRKVKEEFANAKEKEEIIGLVLSHSKKIARRAAVFIIKGDKLTGWKSRGINVDNTTLTVGSNSVFSDVLRRKSYYRGPLLKMSDNEPLIALLSGAPQDCLVFPILIREKIIGLLYADNGNTSVLDAGLNFISMLVSMASISFEIAILRRKILEL
jgi:MshEN domain